MGSPQVHTLMCEKHYGMSIDVICEDCDEFICSNCVKEGHKDHNWQKIQTAATLNTRELLKSLTKIEEDAIQQIDKNIQRVSQEMDENKKRCEDEVSRLYNHYDAIVEKLKEIKRKHEKSLRDSLEGKNAEVSKTKSSLEEKKKSLLRRVRSLREDIGTMTDIVVLKAYRDLTKFLSSEEEEDKEGSSIFPLRYEAGNINRAMLESSMGDLFNSEQINVTMRESFQWGNALIILLEAINEDKCLIGNTKSPFLEQVYKNGKTQMQFRVDAGDVCVTHIKETYVTDLENHSISRLSSLGSVFTAFSTDPLEPWGICQTIDGNLLITLRDTESEEYELNSRSRRLVRHVTLTDDVIREYEYREDGQTRLFTWPGRVTQNGNKDICVINMMSDTYGELVIVSFSGSLKAIYYGQDPREEFNVTDVVCDSHFNILLCEAKNSKIHLLSPEGKFMRYLLTENQVNHPFAMSLKKTTLWIGGDKGFVKVFRYET